MRIIAITLFIILLSCEGKKESFNCKYISFKREATQHYSSHKEEGYDHYIKLEGYDSRCFPYVKFGNIAQYYIDTCAVHVPIRTIYFMSGITDCGFDSGELNFQKIAANFIIGFRVRSKKLSGLVVVDGETFKGFKFEGCVFKE